MTARSGKGLRVGLALGLALAASARAGPQSSADYALTAGSMDGGGLRTASKDYASDDSLSAGEFAASEDFAQRGGYIGQLNNAPVATNDVLVAYTNSTIKLAISALLRLASDADGDTIRFLSVAAASAQGGVVDTNGPWLLYQPPVDFIGADQFVWMLEDAEGDRSTGMVLVRDIVPPGPANAPTLNLISIVFDPTPGATDATLRFASLPGETYTVQYTDSLQPPVAWTTLGTATTTNGAFQIEDPTARAAGGRYYRAFIQP